MEGIPQLAPSRLAEYRHDHPEATISHVEGWWRAWIPEAPGSTSGTELRPCRRLADLLDRLDGLGA